MSKIVSIIWMEKMQTNLKSCTFTSYLTLYQTAACFGFCVHHLTHSSAGKTARDSAPVPASKLFTKLTSAEISIHENIKDWYLWYHQSASETKDMPVVLQSTLQGWSQLGYSTETPCNTTVGLGTSPHVLSRWSPAPSATYTISYRIQSSQYENTWQVQAMNLANINPENTYMQAYY